MSLMFGIFVLKSLGMASVYILFSENLNKYYIGSCLDLDERLILHKNNTFKNSFTSNSDDWFLFLSLNDLEYSQARKIEVHIKSMKSKIYIENLKKYTEMQDKLIQRFQ
jgi:putative endonuclease